jgi:hypothetical protein
MLYIEIKISLWTPIGLSEWMCEKQYQICIRFTVVQIEIKWMWSGASVAHTPSVREDLGSIPHPNPGRHFRKLSSPFFQTTDLKTIKLCDVKKKRFLPPY